MNERRKVGRLQFLFGVAEQCAVRGIALLENAPPICDRDSRGNLLVYLAKKFLSARTGGF